MITIIVLLILAGASIATITGYDSIPDNAKTAVDASRQDTTVEQTMVNSINNLFEKYLPNGDNNEEDDDVVTPEVDTNAPTVTAKQEQVTIEENADNEISTYFEIDKNGTSNIKTTTYIDTSNGDATVTNTSSLAVGTHIIKCIVVKENDKQAEATVEIVVQEEGTIPLTGIAEVDASGLATKKTLIKPNADRNEQIVIPEGWAPAILTGSTSTTSSPGQNGSVASIMPADQWKNITIDQINQGIVIVDHAITYDNGQATGTVPDFNEFVWVPIPDSDDFDRTAWTTAYGYDANGNWVEGTGVTHPLADTSTANKYWDDKTTTEYTNMVSSVNTHKGFYIGRYEASVNGTIAQSKRGQTAKVEISQTESITACISNTSIPNMHLMYGIEWDSTLNWLNGNATIASSTAGATKTMELADLQTNSATWGNYSNTTGDAASEPWVTKTKQNTGASEYWKANNIYDLAGNVYEWTQEKYSTGNLRSRRGGLYNYDGDYYPAAFRYNVNASDTGIYIRFQSQLLLVALTSGMKNYNK